MIFFCIADKESSLGFKFAGLQTREVTTRNEAMEALRVALAMENVGIIIITEKPAALVREEVDKLLYRQGLPLILEVPSRTGPGRRKSAGEYLKEMVGLSI